MIADIILIFVIALAAAAFVSSQPCRWRIKKINNVYFFFLYKQFVFCSWDLTYNLSGIILSIKYSFNIKFSNVSRGYCENFNRTKIEKKKTKGSVQNLKAGKEKWTDIIFECILILHNYRAVFSRIFLGHIRVILLILIIQEHQTIEKVNFWK